MTSDVTYHYIPNGIGEVLDHLGMMMLSSPQFRDRTGLLPGRNIDTVFAELEGGLDGIRKRVGEQAHETLVGLAARMRAHFEADPEDKGDDSVKGRQCIFEMEDILRAASRLKR